MCDPSCVRSLESDWWEIRPLVPGTKESKQKKCHCVGYWHRTSFPVCVGLFCGRWPIRRGCWVGGRSMWQICVMVWIGPFSFGELWHSDIGFVPCGTRSPKGQVCVDLGLYLFSLDVLEDGDFSVWNCFGKFDFGQVIVQRWWRNWNKLTSELLKCPQITK